MVSSLASICLNGSGLLFFKLKWKTKNELTVEFQCPVILKFKKPFLFNVLCPNCSMEIKIKTLFLLSYFNLSKKSKWHFR